MKVTGKLLSFAGAALLLAGVAGCNPTGPTPAAAPPPDARAQRQEDMYRQYGNTRSGGGGRPMGAPPMGGAPAGPGGPAVGR